MLHSMFSLINEMKPGSVAHTNKIFANGNWTKREKTTNKIEINTLAQHKLKDKDPEGKTIGPSSISVQDSMQTDEHEQGATWSTIKEQKKNFLKLSFPMSLLRLFLNHFLFGLPENSWCALRIQGKTSSLAFVSFLQTWNSNMCSSTKLHRAEVGNCCANLKKTEIHRTEE